MPASRGALEAVGRTLFLEFLRPFYLIFRCCRAGGPRPIIIFLRSGRVEAVPRAVAGIEKDRFTRHTSPHLVVGAGCDVWDNGRWITKLQRAQSYDGIYATRRGIGSKRSRFLTIWQCSQCIMLASGAAPRTDFGIFRAVHL